MDIRSCLIVCVFVGCIDPPTPKGDRDVGEDLASDSARDLTGDTASDANDPDAPDLNVEWPALFLNRVTTTFTITDGSSQASVTTDASANDLFFLSHTVDAASVDSPQNWSVGLDGGSASVRARRNGMTGDLNGFVDILGLNPDLVVVDREPFTIVRGAQSFPVGIASNTFYLFNKTEDTSETQIRHAFLGLDENGFIRRDSIAEELGLYQSVRALNTAQGTPFTVEHLHTTVPVGMLFYEYSDNIDPTRTSLFYSLVGSNDGTPGDYFLTCGIDRSAPAIQCERASSNVELELHLQIVRWSPGVVETSHRRETVPLGNSSVEIPDNDEIWFFGLQGSHQFSLCSSGTIADAIADCSVAVDSDNDQLVRSSGGEEATVWVQSIRNAP